jgi:hypothetical protein
MSHYFAHFLLTTLFQQPFPTNPALFSPMDNDQSLYFNTMNVLRHQETDSEKPLADLVNDVRQLQDVLYTKLQTRREAFEKKRCYLLHEVKNALTGILACAEVLGCGDLNPLERDEFFQLIGREIERMVGMTSGRSVDYSTFPPTEPDVRH